MKFGLFYEHQLPKPYDGEQWDPEAEHRLFKDALDQKERIRARTENGDRAERPRLEVAYTPP